MFSGDVQKQGRTATGFLFKFIFCDHISGTKAELQLSYSIPVVPFCVWNRKKKVKRKWAFFVSGKHDGATISK